MPNKKQSKTYFFYYLISETEKQVWQAKVNVKGFASVFLMRDVNIRSPPGPRATLRRNSKLNMREKRGKFQRNDKVDISKIKGCKESINKVPMSELNHPIHSSVEWCQRSQEHRIVFVFRTQNTNLFKFFLFLVSGQQGEKSRIFHREEPVLNLFAHAPSTHQFFRYSRNSKNM